eukprot:Gregarina_sp_Poly_1__805@NODE_1192_length_4819_cov_79_115320_g819_i0_p4_GENE_NODE_1192_length_4819_cov_79_115320_g819_i0NODE_1192_length_4819_cov_79_115320_g819_i0_p4_ORF_typecomplete_len179_score32_29Phage_hub_GP28/PF11110_8/0_023_NODE_1192_length_4819_cov_79_115320_g819_i010681604
MNGISSSDDTLSHSNSSSSSTSGRASTPLDSDDRTQTSQWFRSDRKETIAIGGIGERRESPEALRTFWSVYVVGAEQNLADLMDSIASLCHSADTEFLTINIREMSDTLQNGLEEDRQYLGSKVDDLYLFQQVVEGISRILSEVVIKTKIGVENTKNKIHRMKRETARLINDKDQQVT